MTTKQVYRKSSGQWLLTEVPSEFYPDKNITVAWLNVRDGTSFKASEIHWSRPLLFEWEKATTPTNNMGTK